MIINKIQDLENLEYGLRKYLENLKYDIEQKDYHEELMKNHVKDYINTELIMLKDLYKSLNKIYKRTKKTLDKS
tara:strand:- start:346 stop:567 length:222 start_codon:yes stop_codon:yes gene_type:complete